MIQCSDMIELCNLPLNVSRKRFIEKVNRKLDLSNIKTNNHITNNHINKAAPYLQVNVASVGTL